MLGVSEPAGNSSGIRSFVCSAIHSLITDRSASASDGEVGLGERGAVRAGEHVEVVGQQRQPGRVHTLFAAAHVVGLPAVRASSVRS